VIGADPLTSTVAQAVEEIRSTFADSSITATADADGGAWIVIDGIDLGPKWTPSRSWLAFHLAATYPYADVYPHFMDGALTLAAGGFPDAVTPRASFPGHPEPCLQISRKSNRWNPANDTAAVKALKVIEWLRSR
jgi:hypothetical protein